MSIVNDCLIINMDNRPDLWDGLKVFREAFTNVTHTTTNNTTVNNTTVNNTTTNNTTVNNTTTNNTTTNKIHRIPGPDYTTQPHVLNQYIKENRINLNGSGFRQTKRAFVGELGCFQGHYNAWKYIVDNKLECALVIEDGITMLRNDYHNITIDETLDIMFVNEEMTTAKTEEGIKFVGYGLQGYALTNKGAHKLLKLCYTLNSPIDLQIRHLCNIDELNATTIRGPFVKRNHYRVSSIEGIILNDRDNLNAKQSQHSLIQRILTGLLEQNVDLGNYV